MITITNLSIYSEMEMLPDPRKAVRDVGVNASVAGIQTHPSALTQSIFTWCDVYTFPESLSTLNSD
jgi:hypothetical protein